MPIAPKFVRQLRLVVGFAAIVGLIPFARAADEDGKNQLKNGQSAHWGLGIAAVNQQSPYWGIGDKTTGLPLISYDGTYVRIVANKIDIKLPSAGDFDFSLRAKLALGEGYKASDSSYLTGMANRDGGVYLGTAVTWQSSFAKISAELLSDSSSHSNGTQLKVEIEHPFYYNKRFELTPHIGVTGMDQKYVDYYYGVTAGEATPTRARYVGDATTNTEIGLRMGYLFDTHQRIVVDIVGTYWGSNITASPLVNKSSSTDVMIGYLYSF